MRGISERELTRVRAVVVDNVNVEPVVRWIDINEMVRRVGPDDLLEQVDIDRLLARWTWMPS